MAQQRPASQQRSATKPRPAPQRSAQRPAVSQQLPSNLMRDVEARNLGNQRQVASRQAYRPPSTQFSRSPASFAPQRSFAPQGGFGGGGGGFRGGGRGGGRR
jgi:uncharacterized membrane protein